MKSPARIRTERAPLSSRYTNEKRKKKKHEKSFAFQDKGTVPLSCRGTPHEFLLFTHNKWKKQGGHGKLPMTHNPSTAKAVPLLTGARTLCHFVTSPCTAGSHPLHKGGFLVLERSETGVPEKYCAANFLGRGETNVANLKGLLANLFLLRNLFGRAGVPPTTLHSSLFTIHCVKVSFTLNPRNFPKHTEFSNALLLKICSACFYSSSVCKENNYLQLLLRFRFFFDFTVLGKEPYPLKVNSELFAKIY